jgi:hypothetical protein
MLCEIGRVGMRRTFGFLLVVTIFLVSAGTAAAHPTRDFHACAAYNRAGHFCEERGVAYTYGRTVRLRGHAQPSHTWQVALVVRRNPYSSRWRVVDEVPISDSGRMRWSWRTTMDDAVQRRPYEFRFRIPGHGLSNPVEAYVLFGE